MKHIITAIACLVLLHYWCAFLIWLICDLRPINTPKVVLRFLLWELMLLSPKFREWVLDDYPPSQED